MTRRVLIDTGPIVALLNRHDQHYDRCLELALTLPGVLFTSAPVLTEAGHITERFGGAPARSVLKAVRDGQLQVLPLVQSDWLAIDDLLAKYADQKFSIADASLMHLAERDGIPEVFTVDAGDFSQFRTGSGAPLTVLS